MANFYDYYEYDASIGDIYVPTPGSVAGPDDNGGQLSAQCVGFV